MWTARGFNMDMSDLGMGPGAKRLKMIYMTIRKLEKMIYVHMEQMIQ
jgi:hypothetical protein